MRLRTSWIYFRAEAGDVICLGEGCHVEVMSGLHVLVSSTIVLVSGFDFLYVYLLDMYTYVGW